MIEFNRNRVKAERIARGYTVHEMAEKLNVSSGTYSKKETGKLRINVEDLSDILNVLEIPERDCGIFFTKQVGKMETEKEEVK